MADVRADHEIVTDFLLKTCGLRLCLNYEALQALTDCVSFMATRCGSCGDNESEHIYVTTGSVAEFYIKPMLSCVGDKDFMFPVSYTHLTLPTIYSV